MRGLLTRVLRRLFCQHRVRLLDRVIGADHEAGHVDVVDEHSFVIRPVVNAEIAVATEDNPPAANLVTEKPRSLIIGSGRAATRITRDQGKDFWGES